MATKTDSTLWGTGRRKTAIARVRIQDGNGQMRINRKGLEEYFTTPSEKARVMAPLDAVGGAKDIDVFVNTHGGGFCAQAGAISLGIARALIKRNPDYEATLRDGKFLTRDSRTKERKKYGRAAARRSFQFSKR